MNRIVREHYPAAKLPEDLREGLGPDETVRITIEAAVNDAAPHPEPELGNFSRFRHLRRNNFASAEDVASYVRSIRDEWIDRDRLNEFIPMLIFGSQLSNSMDHTRSTRGRCFAR